jgi:oligosaccharide repeat unit polymerase
MSTVSSTWRPFAYDRMRIPASAFEVLTCLTVVAAASLAFLAGWLAVNAAVVLTVLLLTSLIILSWLRLGRGRHPCFLFLCTLMFFQGGRLLAYCLGGEPDPMRIRAMGADSFTVGQSYEGLVLLCLALSAVCIYAVCRWNYAPLNPPDAAPVRRYLPYLYLAFALTLPAQLFKNYRYFQYVQDHGGYFAIYQNYAGLAASTPLIVRAIALFTLPVFVAIFVFEDRKKLVAIATILYFAAASMTLLMGARLSVFALILTLWYVSRMKSTRRQRIVRLLILAVALSYLAQFIGSYREDAGGTDLQEMDLAKFVALEGTSIDVTSLAVRYRDQFSRYAPTYLLFELQDAYGSTDVQNYAPGKTLAYDVSVFLNPILFDLGGGVGGSYIGQAYVTGGIVAVVIVSLLVGLGLHLMYRSSQHLLLFLLVVLTMPIVLYMPRGDLIGWVSILARNAILLLLLALGWQVYALLASLGRTPLEGSMAASAGPAGLQ